MATNYEILLSTGRITKPEFDVLENLANFTETMTNLEDNTDDVWDQYEDGTITRAQYDEIETQNQAKFASLSKMYDQLALANIDLVKRVSRV